MQVEAAGTVFMWEVIIRICLWILESVKKRIEEGLKTLDLKGDDLNGILITHEHSDHIQGLGYSAESIRSRSMPQKVH